MDGLNRTNLPRNSNAPSRSQRVQEASWNLYPRRSYTKSNNALHFSSVWLSGILTRPVDLMNYVGLKDRTHSSAFDTGYVHTRSNCYSTISGLAYSFDPDKSARRNGIPNEF
ncbi:hypothetical protein PILCRDRAFT_823631 [Piloderma croceum F 1598]|uniref:Uncharacterized protein n=1 Tax=Piloderma croceum (strain F 1598) TaxID=765440 RepID=A0A0C3AZE0_PILCF|nr:hypothetical protein PILCRDRAFT_823631 [Piloderma croceum F 1598]